MRDIVLIGGGYCQAIIDVIEHGSIIGDHCHISTNAIINGNVKIGESCFIGSESEAKEGIKIEHHSFVRAGSVLK